jgi:DNA-binding NarL/FixJ family response regulator
MPTLQRPRVLIADDHVEMLQRTREILEADFDVVAAVSDGMAAVEAATQLRPDVVVLDISMPVLSGVEAATRLLAATSPPIVVFLTVHEDSAYRDMAERLGAAGFVLKRDMLSDLVDSIQRALAAARVAPLGGRRGPGPGPAPSPP